MLYPNVNVFVDGGGNNYPGVERYLSNFPEFFKVYVFEPNPLFYKSYEGRNVILEKKAIWTSDGTLPFYLSKDDNQVSSSLIRDKLCRTDDTFQPFYHDYHINVECVNFSKWIEEHIKSYHKLTVKLDIEGAEYAVLRKMMKDGSINRIRKLFVEFHPEAMKMDQEEHDLFVKDLESVVELHPWD